VTTFFFGDFLRQIFGEEGMRARGGDVALQGGGKRAGKNRLT